MNYHKRILLSLTIISFSFQVRCKEEKAPVVDLANGANKIIIPDLPLKHYEFWIKNNPISLKIFEEICSQVPNPLELTSLRYFQSLHTNLSFEDPLYLTDLHHGKLILNKICTRIGSITKVCWGYERDCHDIYLMPECYGSSLGEAKNDQEQKIIWFNQADFGYVLERRREMLSYCSPDKYSNDSIKSSLQCTKYFRTCRGANLLMKFNDQKHDSSAIQTTQSSKISELGGWNCDLQIKRIKEESGQEEPLQSWFPEFNKYQLMQDASPEQVCDMTIDKQVFLVKLDNPSNMFHYFCTYLNLYLTMHLNNKFSTDNLIIIWDEQLPKSKFESVWSVFSKNQIETISQYKGKRVCFKKFISSLLPRMVNGLYFDTPLIPGCCKTGLFDAFNKHVLHKLKIPQHYDVKMQKQNANRLIRITISSRSTLHRRIVNEMHLRQAAANISDDIQVQLVDFNGKENFRRLLEITQNTDILIAIHGQELTYSLFLPSWAAVFELHNFGDQRYYNMARLRGITHFTFNDVQKAMTKVPVDDKDEVKKLQQAKLFDQDKFSNYQVNIGEFVDVISRAIEKIRKVRSRYFDDHDKTLEEIKEEKTKPATTQPQQSGPRTEL